MRLLLIAAALLACNAHAWAAGTLRWGLDADLDTFDPARSGSYVERIVNSAMCDQLMEIDDKLNVVPELATAWEWSTDQLSLLLHLRPNVVFQDGTKFDALVVRDNLLRYANADYSARKGELTPIVSVEPINPLLVLIRLKRPYAPLLTLLANRAGVMLSPKSLAQKPEEIAAHPVCAGPFSLVERVPQDHITLQRFPGYWNAAAVSLDRIEFKIIPDSSIRRVNLQSGQLDVVARLAATDVPIVQGDKKLQLAQSPSLGFEMLSFNLNNGPASETPFAADKRIRQAFAKSLDLDQINKIVFDGRFVPDVQTEARGTRYYDPAYPVPRRDLSGARQLLADEDEPHPKLRLSVVNNPVDVQVGEVIQSMAAEAGFEVTLDKGEAVSLTQAAGRGEYQAYAVIWSGRPDPDGNISIWMRCAAPLNWTGWCDPAVDAGLAQATGTLKPEERMQLYHQVNDIWMDELPYLPLYHFTWLWGLSAKVTGFTPRPDGVVRPIGLGLKP